MKGSRYHAQPAQFFKFSPIALFRYDFKSVGKEFLQSHSCIQKFRGIPVHYECSHQLQTFIHAEPVDFIRKPPIPVKSLSVLKKHIPHSDCPFYRKGAFVYTGGNQQDIRKSVSIHILESNPSDPSCGLHHLSADPVIGHQFLRPVYNASILFCQEYHQPMIPLIKSWDKRNFPKALQFYTKYLGFYHSKSLIGQFRYLANPFHTLKITPVFHPVGVRRRHTACRTSKDSHQALSRCLRPVRHPAGRIFRIRAKRQTADGCYKNEINNPQQPHHPYTVFLLHGYTPTYRRLCLPSLILSS